MLSLEHVKTDHSSWNPLILAIVLAEEDPLILKNISNGEKIISDKDDTFHLRMVNNYVESYFTVAFEKILQWITVGVSVGRFFF